MARLVTELGNMFRGLAKKGRQKGVSLIVLSWSENESE